MRDLRWNRSVPEVLRRRNRGERMTLQNETAAERGRGILVMEIFPRELANRWRQLVQCDSERVAMRAHSLLFLE